jgi:hypothetical protein
MIRALRVRHRFAALGLAMVVPPAFALAIAARSPEPRNPDLLAEASAPDDARAVELDTRGAELVPDALVYWSPGASSAASLAPDSVFLGTLPADALRRFTAPGSGAGRVVVYSLAWQRVVRAVPVAPETSR